MYVTGILPGITHGAQVCGIDHAALRQIRRDNARQMKPVVARRSLTAITLASGDPSVEHVVVAATRYVREAWDASRRAD